MKKFAPYGVVVLFAGVVAYVVFGGKVTYEAPQVEKEVIEKTITEEVSELNNRIKAAQEAKMGEIEASAQAAYDNAKTQGLLEIETTVRDEYIKELQTVNKEKLKELQSY